jgi:hypothetical protein
MKELGYVVYYCTAACNLRVDNVSVHIWVDPELDSLLFHLYFLLVIL